MNSADRIERLEAALEKIAAVAPGNGDVCELIARIARRALRGESANAEEDGGSGEPGPI